jgi:hypothetical protein
MTSEWCERCGSYHPATTPHIDADETVERLTDEDVARILRVLPTLEVDGEPAYGVTLGRVGDGPDTLDTYDIHKLVAEVKRLRSDDWLRDALRAIRESKGPPPISLEAMLDVFRKHRDAAP